MRPLIENKESDRREDDPISLFFAKIRRRGT